MDVGAELYRLELALARRDEAAIDGGYDGVLDDAFEEVGRSGRIWTREEMLDALVGAPYSEAIGIVDFRATPLAAGVFLARYDAIVGDARTHRSSIWLRTGNRFRIRYHQGTSAATDP